MLVSNTVAGSIIGKVSTLHACIGAGRWLSPLCPCNLLFCVSLFAVWCEH